MRHFFPILLFLYASSLFALDHSQCTTCHAQGIKDNQAIMATIRPTLPQLCINCHQERMAMGEHVINVRPITAQPSSLPLVNGMVSCTTCHDPHKNARGFLKKNTFVFGLR